MSKMYGTVWVGGVSVVSLVDHDIAIEIRDKYVAEGYDDVSLVKWSEQEVTLFNLFDKGGVNAVCEYVTANYPDWTWSHCETCKQQTPWFTSTENTVICAACWNED